MMNKTIYFLLIPLVILVTGCGSAGNSSSSDPSSLTVWHWMGDRQEAFEELAARYQKLTGIKVSFDLYAPSEAYSQKVKAAAQTKTLPDIYGILGDTRDFASFIKSGYVAEIGETVGPEEIGPFRSRLFEKALEVNTFKEGNEYGVKPGLYGVPLDMTNVQLVYNKDLFRKAGLDPEKPPLTWDDFVKTVRQLRQKDVPVLASGFGEIWLIDILATSFAMNLMGEEKVYDTYRGKVPYTDPDWVRVLALFEEMAEEGAFVSGTVTMVNKTAEQTFANGRAAFAWNGSWCVNVYKGMNPDLDYGVVLPPRINPNRPSRIWGGAGNSLMVNNQSPRKAEAMKFLKWITDDAQQAYFANATNNLPANRNAVSGLAPVLAQFSDDLDNTFHLNTMPAHELPQVVEAWDKGIQSIMIQERTPAQIAQDVQNVKERESRHKS